jgi:hypothetical protein
MKAWLWVFVAAAGWGVMAAAYTTRVQPSPMAPWGHGLVVIGPALPADLAQTGRAHRVRLRLLPAIERTEAILKAMSQVAKDKAAKLEVQLRPKLILLAADTAGIDASSLQSGRMPEAGRDQIIAGASASHKDRVTVGERVLDVVGVLEPELVLLQNDYLIAPSDTASAFFAENDSSVHAATVVQLTSEQFRNRQFLEQLEKSLPNSKYTLVMPTERLAPENFYSYVGGLAAFLLGGSGALIGLFRGLAARARRSSHTAGGGGGEQLDEWGQPVFAKARPAWWAAPLLEMEQRPGLVWGVHLVYFGLVIAGSVLVYHFSDVQSVLLSNVRDALSASSGPLASAAKAYGSGSIPLAAVTTFVINFFLGSLLMLTLPSMLLPGVGIFMAALRSVLWGLLLAPTIRILAYTMLPHSGTMLLEGEGYILATLFGLLVPIHIVQSSLGGTPLSRFGRVLWLNVLANFWVAVVLVVAACYESTEVILMNR